MGEIYGYQTDLVDPGFALFVYPLVTMFAWNFLVGIWVQIWGKRDNSWMDVNYGICFIIPNTYIFIARRDQITARMILVTAIVWFWGARLAHHIWARHTREDYRYKKMREDWEAQGTCTYFTKAFGFIYLMQGVFATIVNTSALFVNLYSMPGPDGSRLDLWYTDGIGFAVWLLGFGLEYIADRQLKAHLTKPKPGTGKFIRTGLWRYSRHPNYFGEAVMWWGIYIIACGIDLGWITFISAAFITFLLRFVSGVPFPEEKYKENPEWKIVCEETNVFCLWFSGMGKDSS